MGHLTDIEIRKLIDKGVPFEGISDGLGLTLRWPAGADGKPRYSRPKWRFRYKIGGKPRAMDLGTYGVVGLADARRMVKQLRAEIALGHDPAAQKQQRKIDGKALRDAQEALRTVAQLTEEFMARKVDPKLKRPQDIRQRLEKHIIRSDIGGMYVDQVRPLHVDGLIQGIVSQGKARTANDILRWLRRIFDHGVVRHYLDTNPAAAFRTSDAGGEETSRDRALSLDEIAKLFSVMRDDKRFTRQNELAVKLLLMLGVRKMELLAAPWAEFDIPSRVWHLPAVRAKTEQDIRIPLPDEAIGILRELEVLACGSRYVFPRRRNVGADGHMGESTLNVAMNGLDHGLEHFTIHDFRRTTRTQLAALSIPPHICERCLNHKIPGVAGVYDRYDYFDERKAALESWAAVLFGLKENKVIPIRRQTAV